MFGSFDEAIDILVEFKPELQGIFGTDERRDLAGAIVTLCIGKIRLELERVRGEFENELAPKSSDPKQLELEKWIEEKTNGNS